VASVDDRVVQMQFDNKQFENNVGSTLSMLDKLKNALNFGGATKGLGDLAAAGKSFNLEHMGAAIDGIASRFSAMSVIAFTALSNVVNKAVDSGIALGKSLSLDQVMSGFREYETNMNSIQTILANTKSDGSTLEDVNSSLDQLNQYSDKTIYNFSEMARNIGTFTAAGVGLDDSVNAIKGIANLAAISGSNSQQASTAMYQLSQALAAGKVNLMDWNSVVNAGMGGEVFKKALFETGKAMGTITDVPLSASFDEWEKKGGTFREQMQKGWLTADVLKNTLGAFSGELDASALSALGFSDAAAAEMIELGKLGISAATEVKTLTQLIGTVKESIGSGWSASFRTIFGDFEEAKTLFTEINSSIGAFVGKSADARNELLGGWKFLGGRTMLIDALRSAFQSIAKVLGTVKSAFREVFPAMDAFDLLALTQRFKDFVDSLKPTEMQLYVIKEAFVGFFSIIKIGVEVVKGIISFIGDLFGKFADSGATDGLPLFIVRVAEGIEKLKNGLVDGGKIKDFFAGLADSVGEFIANFSFDNLIQLAKDAFTKVRDAVVAALTTDDTVIGKAFGGIFDRLQERFGWITKITGPIVDAWNWVADNFGKIKDKIGDFGQFIKDTFGDLPQKVADALSGSDYSTALDTVNVGLFGGFVLLFKKFTENGFDFGGIIDGVGKSLEGLTGVLSAMQANLKAEALMKIATAVALITGSVLILSLIDSAALTKAMTAIAIGMGQLVAAMALLNKVVAGPRDAAKLAMVTAGLIALAGALVLLSVATAIMSTMSWEELAKGLVGVTAVLGAVSIAVKYLSKNAGGMIRAGIGLVAVGIALNLLAGSAKIFATMSWEDIGKGMVGIGGGLAILAAAMNLMPASTLLIGPGLVAVALAINMLAGAMLIFATMSWEDIGKGMAGIGGGLLLIAAGIGLMPPTMLLQAAGLIAVGIALGMIVAAVSVFAKMSWKALAKGLVGLAGALIVLAGAAYLMSGSIVGAIAMGIMAISLEHLAKAIKAFASVGWGELFKAMGIFVLSLVVFGAGVLVLGVISPLMVLFGAALLVVGAGLIVFGAGAYLAATAFAILATATTQGIDTLIGALTVFMAALPGFMGKLGEGIIALGQKLLEALPGLVEQLGAVVIALLQVIIDSVPKMAEVFKKLLEAGIDVVVTEGPKVIQAGLDFLLTFLKGIRDNIKEIVMVVADIITNFLDGLTEKLPQIIDSGYNFVVALVKGIIEKLVDVNLAAGKVALQFVKGIGDKVLDVLASGVDTVKNWISGIVDKDFDIVQTGVDVLKSFVSGIVGAFIYVTNAAGDLITKLTDGIGDVISEVYDTGKEIAKNIVEGIVKGIKNAAGTVKDAVVSMLKGAWDAAKDVMKINSPSKVYMEIGESIAEGLVVAFDNDTSVAKGAVGLVTKATDAVTKSLSVMPSILSGLEGFNPTITPVLDLTDVRTGAAQLSLLMAQNGSVTADLSYNQAASLVSATANTNDNALLDTTTAVREIKFEQHNYSPEALTTADIYRQTRSQIAMAKEELAVL